MKKFTLGAIAGMTSLLVAVPIVAQVAGAQSVSSTSTTISQEARPTRPAPTQAEVQKMIEQTDLFLKNIDAMTAAQKTSMQALKTALTAAAGITDDTQRAEALKKAHEAMRTSMEATMKSLGLEGKMMMGPGMGGPGGPHRMMGHGMRGEMKGKLAEKLGMTEVELKAAIDSGKTIEAIAKEKGITLPARPMVGKFQPTATDPDGDGDDHTVTAPTQN